MEIKEGEVVELVEVKGEEMVQVKEKEIVEQEGNPNNIHLFLLCGERKSSFFISSPSEF